MSDVPRHAGRLVRFAVSLGLLIVLAWILDLGQVVARLGRLEAGWVAAALAISIVQVVVSAWRWRFTARCLGLDLPFVAALREYYLAVFLNQVVPGGVVGDVSRAWRHARLASDHQGTGGAALRAVILERASGQVVMMIVAALSLATLPIGFGVAGWVTVAGLGLAAVAVRAVMRRRDGTGDSTVDVMWRDAGRALFSQAALPAQLVSSTVVIGSYIGTYLVSARAVGIETPLVVLVPLVAPVLVSMLVPVTVAGWGVREGAAAALWSVVGLTATDGVAISVTYGLLVLLSTLPGGVLLIFRPTAG